MDTISAILDGINALEQRGFTADVALVNESAKQYLLKVLTSDPEDVILHGVSISVESWIDNCQNDPLPTVIVVDTGNIRYHDSIEVVRMN